MRGADEVHLVRADASARTQYAERFRGVRNVRRRCRGGVRRRLGERHGSP